MFVYVWVFVVGENMIHSIYNNSIIKNIFMECVYVCFEHSSEVIMCVPAYAQLYVCAYSVLRVCVVLCETDCLN